MGGICGFIGLNDKLLLRKMSDAVRHRGPRNEFLIDNNVNFCSKAWDREAQLAGNEDGNVWVAFDGEIYNNFELKQFLEEKGYNLVSLSDAEIIVHLYETLGESCVEKIRGIFVFAIWDSRTERLLLARDKAGLKAVYYTLIDGNFFFASEIKALLQYEGMKRDLDLQALEYFLSWGYVPDEGTLFKGVRRLPPAHLLSYSQGDLAVQEYWKLDFSNVDYKLSEDDWCEMIYNTLLDSIQVRLREPPYGILLGGLDSGSVASVMKRLTQEPIKAFTVTYEQEEFNELYTDLISEWIGIEAHKKVLYAKDVIRALPQIVYIIDDLKADWNTTIPTYIVLEFAKKYVKTVFTGDWSKTRLGYRLDPPEPLGWRLASRIPRTLREKIVLLRTPIFMKKDTCYLARTIRSFNRAVETSCLPPVLRFLTYSKIFDDEDLQELFGYQPLVNVYSPFLECLNKMQLSVKLVENIGWGISRLESLCSLFSLNLRIPIADPKLSEMAARIPLYLLQGPHENNHRYIWKRTASKYGLIPKKVIYQPQRGLGGNPAIANWLRGELKDFVHQTILDGIPNIKWFFNEKYVKRILYKGPSNKILTLLMFILWYEQFFSM